jgi:Methyltransferase FkbM domain
MKTGVASLVKSLLVPDVSRVRCVPFGLYKGIHLNINLKSQTQLALGLWERETYGVIRQAASRAEWFIDVGAGKGELCIFFARLKHVKRIIAIEPDHPEAHALVAHLKDNNIDPNRVEVLEKFSGTANDARYVKIDQLGIVPSAHGFIKIDVDGFELDVLRSGRQLLSQGHADLLVETHSAELERNCIEFLEKLAYTCRVIKYAWWRALLPEQRPIEHNHWFFAEKRTAKAEPRMP